MFSGNVPAGGLSTYFVVPEKLHIKTEEIVTPDSDSGTVLENSHIRALFDGSGALLSMVSKASGANVSVHQSLQWYNASDGSGTVAGGSGSGACVLCC